MQGWNLDLQRTTKVCTTAMTCWFLWVRSNTLHHCEEQATSKVALNPFTTGLFANTRHLSPLCWLPGGGMPCSWYCMVEIQHTRLSLQTSLPPHKDFSKTPNSFSCTELLIFWHLRFRRPHFTFSYEIFSPDKQSLGGLQIKLLTAK